MLAIIGGTGLTQLASLEVSQRQIMRTPYGAPSGPLTLGVIGQQALVFLARHGYGHTIPPHEINYRANVWALQACGASAIVSVASVSCIRPDLKPGDLVIPEQMIDYTWGRKSTYHDGQSCTVTHIDFSQPYDAALRQRLLAAAASSGVPCSDHAVYAAMQGPRLETTAEVERLARDGADVVGMTGMPEAVLARELGIAYAAINVVANYAAGRAPLASAPPSTPPSTPPQSGGQTSTLQTAMQQVHTLIERLLVN
ncbi:MAG: S-methyl-5'-thioinosine phosphorylase [Pseudomonadota bacterium]